MPHISQTAAKTPNKPAIIMGRSGEVITYQQLNDTANQAAHLFRKIGLKSGDHICLIMENCREFLEIFMGGGKMRPYCDARKRPIQIGRVPIYRRKLRIKTRYLFR